MTRRKWLLLIFRATIYQMETLTHTSADTKDEEEAMMEVAGHGVTGHMCF